RQWQPRRLTQLELHQIDAADAFRYRVLHLQAGIHLEEIRLAAATFHDELDRSRAGVINGRSKLDRAGEQLLADRVGQIGSGRFLNDLLMIPLHRAVALVEVQGAAPAVTEYLDFQMTGRLDQLLEEDRVIAEGRTGLGAGTGERAWQIFRPVDPAHAATATTGAGLDHDRIADASGGGDQFLGGGAGAVKAGNNRHAGRLGDAPRLDFRPHRLHGFSRRTDEDQS